MKLEYLLRVENFPQEVREEIERIIRYEDFFSNHEKSSLNELVSEDTHRSRYFLDDSDAAKKLKRKLFSRKDIQFLTERGISLSIGVTADYSFAVNLVEISVSFEISISNIEGLKFKGSQVYHSEKFLLTSTFDIKKNLSFKDIRALSYNRKEELKEEFLQLELFNKFSSPKTEAPISYPIQYSNVIQLLQILEEVRLLKSSKEFKDNLPLLDFDTSHLPPSAQEHCCGFDEKFLQKEVYTRDNFNQLHLFGLFVLHNFRGLVSDTLTLMLIVDFLSKVTRNVLDDRFDNQVDIYCNHVEGECKKVEINSFYRQFMSLVFQLDQKNLQGFLDEITDYYSTLNNKFIEENKRRDLEGKKFEEDFKSLVESGVDFFGKLNKTPDIRELPNFHNQLFELIDKCVAKQHLREQEKEKIVEQIYFSLVTRRQRPPFFPFCRGDHRWDVSHLGT